MNEPDEIAKTTAAFRRLPRGRKIGFLKEHFPEFKPQRVIRDFVIMENHSPNFASPIVIFHLPTMLWAGFNMPFAQALRTLEEHPESDKELIFEIVARRPKRS
jgi:hypothetical protein